MRLGTTRLAVAALLATLPAAAHAATVGYTLTISGSDSNVPTLTLVNDSDAGITLDAFSFSIGLLSRHFDLSDSNAGSFNVGSGSFARAGGSSRVDVVEYTFGGFGAAESFRFTLDVDLDPSANSVQNYKNVFWNNGDGPNSVMNVAFSNGRSFSLTLPDQPSTTPNSYQFSQSYTDPGTAVPLPSTAAAGLSLLGLLGMKRAGRRRAATC